MKSEQETRNKIKEIYDSNAHVLNCKLATIDENSVRALMQLSAISKLDALYWVLDEKRPEYRYDKK